MYIEIYIHTCITYVYMYVYNIGELRLIWRGIILDDLIRLEMIMFSDKTHK